MAGHSEKRLRHKDRQVHSHDGEMARMESAKRKFGPMDGGGKSERPQAKVGESMAAEEYNNDGKTNG